MRRMGWVAIAVLSALPAAADVDVKVGGQIRPRFEVRDPVGIGHDVTTSMRVRANLTAELDREVGAFIQLQDVRLWGEETNTLGDFRADNFDLHQGYVTFGNVGESSIDVRLGRQEMSLGGQRLVGAVGWTQQGRSFDGVRVSDTPKGGNVDLFLMRIGDASASTVSNNAYFGGGYVSVPMRSGGLDLYALYNRTAGAADTDLYTLGARVAAKAAQLTYRAEASYQAGNSGASDVAAFMVGARIGIKLSDKAAVTLWGDLLSGDDDPTDNETKVFNTLFATNHKFYGFADLFLNIPAHTNGQGLTDLAVKFSLKPKNDLTVGVDLHSFRLTEKRTLNSARLGEELDVTFAYKYSKQATIVFGGSYVFQKQALSDIGRLSDDLKWGYVMTNVAF